MSRQYACAELCGIALIILVDTVCYDCFFAILHDDIAKSREMRYNDVKSIRARERAVWLNVFLT